MRAAIYARRCPNPNCVVKVGDGRGFIVIKRVEVPPPPPHLKRRGLKLVSFVEHRLVVTAAHCLPHLPPAHAGSYSSARTYEDLLGSLDGIKKGVWAECLFADPVADIAVLGCPDNQSFTAQADAYCSLTDEASALRIASAKSGRGWVLSLAGRWIRSALEVPSWGRGRGLWISPTMAGQSGSPILNDAGRAIGVVVVGFETTSAKGKHEASGDKDGPQPMLARNLPAWLLDGKKEQRK